MAEVRHVNSSDGVTFGQVLKHHSFEIQILGQSSSDQKEIPKGEKEKQTEKREESVEGRYFTGDPPPKTINNRIPDI
jgi:hypothetical protein